MEKYQLADMGTVAHLVLHKCLENSYGMGMRIPPTYTTAKEFIGQTFQVQDEEHAALSPSGADRWMTCPASVSMGAGVTDPDAPPPGAKREYVFTPEYARYTQECLDYIAGRVLHYELDGAFVVVRSELPVSPDRFISTHQCDGTLDIAIEAYVNDAIRFVEIVDFKAGRVTVPLDTRQLDLYLLGWLAFLPGGGGTRLPQIPARLTLCQPSLFDGTPSIRARYVKDVVPWAEALSYEVMDCLQAVGADSPEFRPSAKACEHCLGRFRDPPCKAQFEYAFQQAGVLDLDEPLPESEEGVLNAAQRFVSRDLRGLTGAQIQAGLEAREMLRGALKALEAFAEGQLKEGLAEPEIASSFKLVRGRGKLAWRDDLPEQELERRLKRIKVPKDDAPDKLRGLGKKDLEQKTLKSAPQVRDMLKDMSIPKDDARMDAFFALTEKTHGKVTLAPIDDPRPAVNPRIRDPQQAFAGADAEEAPPVPV